MTLREEPNVGGVWVGQPLWEEASMRSKYRNLVLLLAIVAGCSSGPGSPTAFDVGRRIDAYVPPTDAGPVPECVGIPLGCSGATSAECAAVIV